jgi:flagellar FliL protein
MDFLTGAGSCEAAAAKGGHGASESDGGHGTDSKNEGGIVALDSFVVNLAEENAQRYLKVSMKVEFFHEVPQSFHPRRPQVRDLVLTLLSSKTVDDVRTAEGKQQLRDEIIARVNRVLKDDFVKAVYFAEFIVQ